MGVWMIDIHARPVKHFECAIKSGPERSQTWDVQSIRAGTCKPCTVGDGGSGQFVTQVDPSLLAFPKPHMRPRYDSGIVVSVFSGPLIRPAKYLYTRVEWPFSHGLRNGPADEFDFDVRVKGERSRVGFGIACMPMAVRNQPGSPAYAIKPMLAWQRKRRRELRSTIPRQAFSKPICTAAGLTIHYHIIKHRGAMPHRYRRY